MKYLLNFVLILTSLSSIAQWNPQGATSGTIYYNGGNVGIGTTSPNAKLEVIGNLAVSTQLHLGEVTSTYVASRRGIFIDHGASTTWNFLEAKNNNGLAFKIQGNGFVGIGTNDPKATLHINNGNLIIENGLSNSSLYTGSTNSDQGKYLMLLNSPISGFGFASGLKSGGVLVSDDYSFANPGDNEIVVKGRAAIGIATPHINSSLVTRNQQRSYFLNRYLGSTEDAGGINYILLHEAYNTTTTTEHYVMGHISAIRGGTSTWNRKISFDVNTSSAYQSNRGSLTSYNEAVRLVYVTYAGVKYVAVEIANGSALYQLSFTGYAENESLIVAKDEQVSSVVAFTNLDPIVLHASKVGIGTTTPDATLTVAGDIKSTGNVKFSGAATIGHSGGHYDEFGFNVGFTNTNDTYTYVGSDYAASIRMGHFGRIEFRSAPSGSAGSSLPLDNKMVIHQNGNVSIGTTSSNTYKLAVDGTIGAREVNVNLNNWPDYVFSSNYNLRPIDEVEKYIKENNHLPEVPSEKEVKENGVNVGEMNAILLKKIEELTLYVIELKKENEEIKKKLELK